MEQEDRSWMASICRQLETISQFHCSDSQPLNFIRSSPGDANAIHDLLDELCEMLAPTDDIKEYCRDIMASSLPPRA